MAATPVWSLVVLSDDVQEWLVRRLLNLVAYNMQLHELKQLQE
jgi:hypothetical protein